MNEFFVGRAVRAKEAELVDSVDTEPGSSKGQ